MGRVTMTWGTYKGEAGTVTQQDGKNVFVKLDRGLEIAASTDHVEALVEPKIVAIKASELVVGDMVTYYEGESLNRVTSVRRTAKSVEIQREGLRTGGQGNRKRLDSTVWVLR